MERSDFAERGELKVDFLKYYRLVSRWATKNNDLNVADLELLFYLDPILYFTIEDFKDGTLFYSWIKKDSIDYKEMAGLKKYIKVLEDEVIITNTKLVKKVNFLLIKYIVF